MYSIQLKIPGYHNKGIKVMAATMLPLTIILNTFLFGKNYFTQLQLLIPATFLTFLILAICFFIYGKIASVIRNRFPEENQVARRMGLSIFVFILMSAVLISFIFRAYASADFFDYIFNERDFTKAFIAVAIINVFVIFLMEGISKFERYRSTATETDELKKEYMKSQLMGLKSQVNPHFLFNSLNTLSCLIHDDAEKAERFVDEMTKVYRYLLRSNEEQLVKVDLEISMLNSYFYLLKERYGDALQLNININDNDCSQMIPPLTLQILFEYIINNNTIRKDDPLVVELTSTQDCWLQLKHNIRGKLAQHEEKDLQALDNISKKFKLLSRKDVIITEEDCCKYFKLPLILVTENAVV